LSIILNGIGVSRGIAIGNAYVYVRATTEATEYNVPAKYHDKEIERLQQAVQDASAQLHEIKNKIAADTPEDILVFIDSHLLMLGVDASATERTDDGDFANRGRRLSRSLVQSINEFGCLYR